MKCPWNPCMLRVSLLLVFSSIYDSDAYSGDSADVIKAKYAQGTVYVSDRPLPVDQRLFDVDVIQNMDLFIAWMKGFPADEQMRAEFAYAPLLTDHWQETADHLRGIREKARAKMNDKIRTGIIVNPIADLVAVGKWHIVLKTQCFSRIPAAALRGKMDAKAHMFARQWQEGQFYDFIQTNPPVAPFTVGPTNLLGTFTTCSANSTASNQTSFCTQCGRRIH